MVAELQGLFFSVLTALLYDEPVATSPSFVFNLKAITSNGVKSRERSGLNLFEVLLTGSHALNVLFYYPIK